MIRLLLNSIALDPNRWTVSKTPHFRLEQLLEPIARTGFRYVETWQHHLCGEPEFIIKRYRHWGEELGLAFPIVGLYPKLHWQGQARARHLQNVEKMFEYGKLLGAEIIKIFVGDRASRSLSETEYASSVTIMQEIAVLAERMELIIAGETHQDTLFDGLETCRKFREDVGADNFKICFQPYDLADTAGAINDFRTLGPDIIHLHLQGRRGSNMALLSSSDLDYGAYLTAVLKEDFVGDLSIEFVKDCVVSHSDKFDLNAVLANARRDREYVLQIAERVGVVIAG